MLVHERRTGTKGISSKAAQKANSAQDGHCHSQENLDHIGKSSEKCELGGDAGTAYNHRENVSCGCYVSVSSASPQLEGHRALIAASDCTRS
jgi:hypothetical protein